MMKAEHFIGVDIGGTKICAAVVSTEGKILLRKKIDTPRQGEAQEIYQSLSGLIRDVIKSAKKIGRPAGIGVGVPGIVSAESGRILLTPNLRMSGFPLAKKMSKDFSTVVAVGNDVDLGLLGEKWLGAGKNMQNLIGIFPGTGVGGGIILRGHLWTGTTGAGAELGHIIMDIDGPVCSCGNRGCLEAMTSRWAIERDIRRAVGNGEKTIVQDLTKGNLSIIKSKMIKKALKLKDPLVTGIIKRASIILGKACVSIRHIFDPEMIILGGGLIEACGSFMLPIIQREVRTDPFFAKFKGCPVVASQLGDDAVVLGAVALIKQSRIKKIQKKV